MEDAFGRDSLEGEGKAEQGHDDQAAANAKQAGNDANKRTKTEIEKEESHGGIGSVKMKPDATCFY